MQDDPVWLTDEIVVAIHEQMIVQFGGLGGVRDARLLDSALSRPRHLFAYGSTDLMDLAGAIAFGIAKNHPFHDGNKRTAFMSAYTFLGLNGLRITATEADAAAATLGLADGSITESGYALFLRDHTERLKPENPA